MDKLLVRGLKRTEIEPLGLSSLDPDSFYITWAMNETWQLQFTARDDGSVAYNMLDDESSVFYDGQEYIVKQCIPDFVDGTKAKDVVATHVYNEVSRIRKYKQYIDTSDPSSGQSTNVKANPDDTGSSGDNSSVTQNGNTTITKTDEGDNQENQIWYSLEDVLKYYLDGNSLGFTYQIIGNFGKSRIEQLQDGNGTDMLSKIVEHWPNAVIFPDNRNIRVYNIDDFEKDYGNRLDYEYNTTEFKLTYDSTSLTNEVFCIGAKYSVETETETDSDSGNSNGAGAQAIIADAKKYLGVPYKYGYGRPVGTANPYNGMDCSSFVSRVYYDFGINIPAYTVSMESYGHEISRDQVQTGDMGFYGSKGASHHICLALDNNTMIYEPQPGEVCKTEPISYYPPTWWERNDDMAKIVAGGSSSGDDDGTASTTDSKEQYYFAPFYFVDEASRQRWGLFVGDDITSDTITDKEQMKAYAESQFKANPDFTLQLTVDPGKEIIEGDMVRLEIRPADYVTKVGLVGYQKYPYSHTQSSTVTLNSNAANILDFQRSQQTNLSKLQEQTKSLIISSNNRDDSNNAWNETEVKAFDNSKRS